MPETININLTGVAPGNDIRFSDTYQFGGFNVSPSDSNEYAIGSQFNSGITTAFSTLLGVPIVNTGIIDKISVLTRLGTIATNEGVSFYIRKNNSTDHLVSDSILFNDSYKTDTITGLNIPVAAGEYLHIKVSTPAWVTNPTGWSTHIVINVKK